MNQGFSRNVENEYQGPLDPLLGTLDSTSGDHWIHSWVHWDPLLEAITMLFQAPSCTPEDQDEVQI